MFIRTSITNWQILFVPVGVGIAETFNYKYMYQGLDIRRIQMIAGVVYNELKSFSYKFVAKLK